MGLGIAAYRRGSDPRRDYEARYGAPPPQGGGGAVGPPAV
jgi:hypothetical protein